jgi:site-specific DNA-methyltransferase (adenine-specific)
MVVAIEDAGFEIRDQIMWVYGSGFPKSLDVSKAIDNAAGANREVVGYRKNLVRTSNREIFADTAPATPAAQQWQGWGTALKPATEPITMARKPFPGTVAANVLEWGTGGINVDGCRVGTTESWSYNADKNGTTFHGEQGERIKQTAAAKGAATVDSNPLGRWPANLIHSGCDEVVAGFPETAAGGHPACRNTSGYSGGLEQGKTPHGAIRTDAGSAARFFYCAKTSKSDRNEGLDDSNGHPTVKPTDLMRYLCRLITPPGGVVLDPFMGSGSTGKAAYLEGFQFIGIEQDPAFVEIARARIAAAVQRSEVMTLEQRVAWLETQVQAQGAKLRKIEAHQQMSIFDALGATP